MDSDLIHGGALDLMRQRFKDAPAPWIDLSTGISPFPYPHTDISHAALRDLPTQAMVDSCRAAMAKAFCASQESIVLAPGSELLIRLLPRVINLKTLAVLTPSYGDHKQVWAAAGCDVIDAADPLTYADDVDAVVVCNPNNPDGRVFSPNELEAARSRLAAHGGWLIIDEAYADLEPRRSLARSGGQEGLIILRSLGKFYGLAGLRLGAALMPPSVRTVMREQLGTWPVAGPALEIGIRVYNDSDWSNEARLQLAAARRRLDAILERCGIPICGGTDLFRLIEVADAYRLWEILAQHGIYVRRFDWSRAHLRIGLPAEEQAEMRLEHALSSSM
ncbi:MAG: threonine-phosphate decarboxylase CobD [Pseudomonadota bacterium]